MDIKGGDYKIKLWEIPAYSSLTGRELKKKKRKLKKKRQQTAQVKCKNIRKVKFS